MNYAYQSRALRSAACSLTARRSCIAKVSPLLKLLAACFVAACSSSPQTPTQLLVTVDAEAEVTVRLKRVRVLLYAADATDPEKPVHQQAFTLSHDDAADERVKLPFSFGVAAGDERVAELVIAGYTTLAANALPVIEHKQRVEFEPGKTVRVRVTLAEVCFNRAGQCMALDVTCAAESTEAVQAGACAKLRADDADAAVDAGSDAADIAADSGSDAAPPAPLTPISTCEFENTCKSEAYPCVASKSFGYSCLGQMAEWQMPDSAPGAKFKPSYDYGSAPGVVIDKVTGLLWQRDLPKKYPGCSGSTVTAGDSCSVAEGARYCAGLRLQGEQWRLPSKVELESLLDLGEHGLNTALIDEQAFPNAPRDLYWTSSPYLPIPEIHNVWAISFLQGYSGSQEESVAFKVRCVRSVLTRAGTPSDRYTVDAVNHTITDTRTHLTWQQTVDPKEISWTDASAHCGNFGAGFRVPTLKELLTLVDPMRFSPAVDPVFAPTNFGWILWASNPDVTLKYNTGVLFSLGTSVNEKFRELLEANPDATTSLSYHVRCVR